MQFSLFINAVLKRAPAWAELQWKSKRSAIDGAVQPEPYPVLTEGCPVCRFSLVRPLRSPSERVEEPFRCMYLQDVDASTCNESVLQL